MTLWTRHHYFSVSFPLTAANAFKQWQTLSKCHLMVLTTEGGQALHSSASVVFLLLWVKPALPKSPQHKLCPSQDVQGGYSLLQTSSHTALIDEILPGRPEAKGYQQSS